MQIYSIYDKEFKRYGRVLEGYDTEELMAAMKTRPVTEGVVYTAEDPELQRLDFAKAASDQLYGGMPIQMGWCNGKNRKLNCLEYHRDSEINFGTSDFILLLGKQDEIDEEWMFDTANVKAFLVPAGVLVDVYATTLHYAPCSKEEGDPFQVLVILPAGTNTDKPEFTPACHEDKLLTARNKWLLAHPDSNEAKNGAVVGLKGVNIEL